MGVVTIWPPQIEQQQRRQYSLVENLTGSIDLAPLGRIERAVLSRFPVLTLLRFSDRPNRPPAGLPLFVGLIATIADSSEKPCCVVMPDSSGVAMAVSVLLAINRLRSEFPDLLRAHASVTFKGGDNVLVHPAGLVYRYDGFFTPDFFKLGILGKKDSLSFKVKDISRLEKTTRQRPKGYLNSDLGRSQTSVLARLLDLETNLNRNVLRNRVLLLGSRRSLIEQADDWRVEIATDHGTIRKSLVDEVPFGKVTEGGQLALLDGYVAEGEPLIAIASRAADLAAHCEASPRLSKSVIVSDIDQLLRDLRSCDSITENQRTIILATDAERDSVRLLEERGCDVWRLTTDEILLGTQPRQSVGALDSLIAKATRVQNLVISEISCNERNLDSAAGELREAAHAAASTDNATVRDLFYSLFRLLMLCAEYVGQNPQQFTETADRLVLSAKEQLKAARVWLTGETCSQINSALENMHIAAVNLSGSNGSPKATALIGAMKQSSVESGSAVVVARSRLEDVQTWIGQSGIQARIYSIDDIPDDHIFERVLVLSWPRSSRFDELVHRYITTDLRLVSYPFEGKWLRQYEKGQKRSRLTSISLKKKCQLLGISSGSESQEVADDVTTSTELVSFDIPEERFLTRRKGSGRAADSGTFEQEALVEASYVDFVGPTFAYLTEGHEVAVLNAYISSQAGGSKVPMRSVDELKLGDYILFRESGDSDIIRFIAEDEAGKDTYQRLRTEATRWRKALNTLGTDPRKVWDRLRSAGFARHLLTVKSWMYDENRICPKDIEDVRKIAEASSDQELLDALPEVEKAKEELMSLHISAGFRLTQLLMRELPGRIGSLAKGETEVDLDIGKVWIVRIQEIERNPSLQRRSQVNRLLWDESGF